MSSSTGSGAAVPGMRRRRLRAGSRARAGAALAALLACGLAGAGFAAGPTLRGRVELHGETLGSPGETLTVAGSVVGRGVLGAAEVVNQGTIDFTEGESEVAGRLDNRGSLRVTGARARFGGAVTNRGRIEITDAEVRFAAPYRGLGAYVSDPSDNYFTDLVIGSAGYLVGGPGDRFFVSGDFVSASTANTSWSTGEAYLEFRTGLDAQHAFHVTGAELGPSPSGYADNFAWGTLHVAAGNQLELFDGNATPGAALYAGEVTGAALSGSNVTNISGADGVNVYYQPDLPGNAYLGGAVYDFGGSGQLRPIAAPPVPAASPVATGALAALLLAAGLLAAARPGRRPPAADRQ